MAKQSFKDMIFKLLRKDEDAPANATGTAVAGTGDDSSTVVVRKKKRLQSKLMKRMGITETINKTIPDLEYPKDEIRERANQLKEYNEFDHSSIIMKSLKRFVLFLSFTIIYYKKPKCQKCASKWLHFP